MKYVVFLAFVAVAHCAVPQPISLPEPARPAVENYVNKIENAVLRNQLRMLPNAPVMNALAKTIANAEQQLKLKKAQEAVKVADNVAEVIFEVDPVYEVKVVDAPVETESKVAEAPVEAVKVVDMAIEAPVQEKVSEQVYEVKVVDAPVETESKVAEAPFEAVKVVDMAIEAPVQEKVSEQVYEVKVVDAPVETESKVAEVPVEAVKVVDMAFEAPVQEKVAEQVNVAAMPAPDKQLPKSFLRN